MQNKSVKDIKEIVDNLSVDQYLEYIDILNDAESLMYKVEEGLGHSKSGMDRSKKSEIKGNLRNLKKLIKKTKRDNIFRKII